MAALSSSWHSLSNSISSDGVRGALLEPGGWGVQMTIVLRYQVALYYILATIRIVPADGFDIADHTIAMVS